MNRRGSGPARGLTLCRRTHVPWRTAPAGCEGRLSASHPSGVIMKGYGILAAAAAIGAMALTGAPGASAKAGDATAAGKCSGASTYKLKVGPRDAGLDTAFEVDSNVVGQTWNWKLKDNGGLVA